MPDYQKGKIYKIEPICEHEEGDIYIGSTTKEYLSKRLAEHRIKYKNKNKNSNITSFQLFDKYDLENCKIFLLENYPCNSKDELRAKEGEYIRNIKCINKKIECRTDKQYKIDNKDKLQKYYYDNKEHIMQYFYEYKEKNKESISENRKQTTFCECGCEIVKYNLKRHLQTKKHINAMNNKERISENHRNYVENNKEIIKQKKSEYREKNKEITHEKAKVKITCECGCLIRKGDISKHIKTQKHINLMNNKENIK